MVRRSPLHTLKIMFDGPLFWIGLLIASAAIIGDAINGTHSGLEYIILIGGIFSGRAFEINKKKHQQIEPPNKPE